MFLVRFLLSILDLNGAIDHETGYPFGVVSWNTLSLSSVNVLASLVVILILPGTLS